MYRPQFQCDGIREEPRVLLGAQNSIFGLVSGKGDGGAVKDVGIGQETSAGRIS